jgi:hypothetical protein
MEGIAGAYRSAAEAAIWFKSVATGVDEKAGQAGADSSAQNAIAEIKKQSAAHKAANKKDSPTIPKGPGGGGGGSDSNAAYKQEFATLTQQLAMARMQALSEEERAAVEFKNRYSDIMKGPYTGKQKDELLQALGELQNQKYEMLNQMETEKQQALNTKILEEEMQAHQERVDRELEIQQQKREQAALFLEEQTAWRNNELETVREHYAQLDQLKRENLITGQQFKDAEIGIMQKEQAIRQQQLSKRMATVSQIGAIIGKEAAAAAVIKIVEQGAKAKEDFAAAKSLLAAGLPGQAAMFGISAVAHLKAAAEYGKVGGGSGGGGGGGGGFGGGGGGKGGGETGAIRDRQLTHRSLLKIEADGIDPEKLYTGDAVQKIVEQIADEFSEGNVNNPFGK